jgi:hypothetical protein
VEDIAMAVFYYRKGDSVIGPMIGVDLREAAFTGAVLSATLISSNLAGPWVTADCAVGLFDQEGNPLPHPPETLQEMAAIGKSIQTVADSQHAQGDQAVQPNYIDFTSPCCSFSMQVPAALEGKQGKCPRCESVVLFTAAQAAFPTQSATTAQVAIIDADIVNAVAGYNIILDPRVPISTSAPIPTQPAAASPPPPPLPPAQPPPLWTPIVPETSTKNPRKNAVSSASKEQFRNDSYLNQAQDSIQKNQRKQASQVESKGSIGVKIVAKCVIVLALTIGLVVFGSIVIGGFNNMKDWRGEFVEKNMERKASERSFGQ